MSKFLYKLTDSNGDSGLKHTRLHWSEGARHEIAKELRDKTKPLYSMHYIHAYENPYIAVLMNSMHGNFRNPILWQATGWISTRDQQLKCGCFSLKTLRQIPLPTLTTAQRVRIAIYCALALKQSQNFKIWAENWLTGKARTAAAAAYAAAHVAHVAAAHAADAAAMHAAHAAMHAAYAAAYAAAHVAAVHAAKAAVHAAHAAKPFKLVKIINRVLREEPV